MADDLITIADLAVINDKNLADIEVTDLLNKAPMLARLYAQPSSNGTEHKYTKETAAPVVGFRAANDGRELDKSEDTLVTISLKILDATFGVDVAIADRWKHGANDFIARRALRHIRAAFFGAERQIINGKKVGGLDSGADAHTGFADVFPYKDSDMVVDAGGTTADTATSIYLIRTSEEAVSAVCGDLNGEDRFDIQVLDTTIQKATGATTGTYPQYYTPIYSWLGVQVGSKYDLARICNITKDAGKTATDDLIYQGLELFPSDAPPNLILMSRRSRRQVRDSRTATNKDGSPAPWPQEIEGIPIVTTEAIINTEALLGATP